MKKILAAAILAATATSAAFAAEYFVVVPVSNKSPSAGNVMVSLSGYSMPSAVVGRAYAGFDFNSVLQVRGDPNYTAGNVRWSVAGGSLPAGLLLGANGKLTGTPTTVGTSSFQVMAAYKTKAGEQTYQVLVADVTVTLAAATLPDTLAGTVFSYDFKQNVSVSGDATYAGDGSGVTWSASGALPAGLTLGATTGVLSGTPTAIGSSTVTVSASYRSKSSTPTNYSLLVYANVKSNGTYRAWSDGTLAASCNAYRNPTSTSYQYAGDTGSGLYRLNLGGAATTAYCDMTTLGGGWTLVGRSSSGGSSTSFGFNYATGSVTSDAAPYSLGSVPALNPTQLLFGAYAGNFTWGAYSYTKPIPSGYWTTLASTYVNNGSPAPVRGGNAIFHMADFVGYTNINNGFYFRDVAGSTGYTFYGLSPNSWATGYSDDVAGIPGASPPGGADGYAGFLNTQQGWIFVR